VCFFEQEVSDSFYFGLGTTAVVVVARREAVIALRMASERGARASNRQHAAVRNEIQKPATDF